MLLFIKIRFLDRPLSGQVSIHLMLLFILPARPPAFPDTEVSIHLMLLFIGNDEDGGFTVPEFQYISCYSLSEIGMKDYNNKLCFNTSHVTLYRCRTQIYRYYANVSIHLMLLFIFTPLQIMLARLAFQYISCYSLSP